MKNRITLSKFIVLIYVLFLYITTGCRQQADSVELERIFISKMPTETSFFVGETLDFTGLEVVAVYSDGAINVIDDYDVEPKDGELIKTSGRFDVTITYSNRSCSFPLNAEESYFSLPVITEQPKTIRGLICIQ